MKSILTILIFCAIPVISQTHFDNFSQNQMNTLNYRKSYYDVKAYLKDGTVLEDTSDISYSLDHSAFIRTEGKIVYPSQTDSIYMNGFKGIPDSGEWLFQKINGNITVFSFNPDSSNESFNKFRKNSGEIQEYTFSNMWAAMSDNPRAKAILHSCKKKRTIRRTMLIFSTGFLIVALTQLGEEETPTSFKVCMSLSAASLVGSIASTSRGALKDAIIIYNEEE